MPAPSGCELRSNLSRDASGRVHYRFKKAMANGATEIVLEPIDFVARLVALIPPPRAHLTRYQGALAPNSPLRREVVLAPRPNVRKTKALAKSSPAPTPALFTPPRRIPWADVLKRVFAIDVLKCDRCPGRMQILAHLTERSVVKGILEHLGLPSALPPRGSVAPLIGDATSWPPRADGFLVDPADEGERYVDATTGCWVDVVPPREPDAEATPLNSHSRAIPGEGMGADPEGARRVGGAVSQRVLTVSTIRRNPERASIGPRLLS